MGENGYYLSVFRQKLNAAQTGSYKVKKEIVKIKINKWLHLPQNGGLMWIWMCFSLFNTGNITETYKEYLL